MPSHPPRRSIEPSAADLLQRVQDVPELREALDKDSCMAITAYTYDSGAPPERNLYFVLNSALRNRRSNPEALQPWKVQRRRVVSLSR